MGTECKMCGKPETTNFVVVGFPRTRRIYACDACMPGYKLAIFIDRESLRAEAFFENARRTPSYYSGVWHNVLLRNEAP